MNTIASSLQSLTLNDELPRITSYTQGQVTEIEGVETNVGEIKFYTNRCIFELLTNVKYDMMEKFPSMHLYRIYRGSDIYDLCCGNGEFESIIDIRWIETIYDEKTVYSVAIRCQTTRTSIKFSKFGTRCIFTDKIGMRFYHAESPEIEREMNDFVQGQIDAIRERNDNISSIDCAKHKKEIAAVVEYLRALALD